MRAVYIDTEFTQLNMTRQLISLALVDTSGLEFYVEITGTWLESECSEFVKEIVLPQLNLDKFGMSTSQARIELKAFLATLGAIEIIGDALTWDWPLFLELLGPEGLPENIIGCREIDPEALELAAEMEHLLADAPHHALLDARMLCAIHEAAQA
ncbi:MAG: 3'-5' exoribonuclease [Pseudomonadaceae bacterium]|nr:3'-5' exoribonuclease [Pseudomonadaceae bacterium]